MRAALWNTACLVSLALSFATMGFWVRSHYRGDRFGTQWVDPENRAVFRRGFDSANKSLLYDRYDERFLDADHEIRDYVYPPSTYHGTWRWTSAPGRLHHPTFQWYQKLGLDARIEWKQPDPVQAGVQRTIIFLRVPHGLVAGLFAIPPAVWTVWRLRRLRRDRRVRRGLCPACGYDLRATAAGGACPECGRASDSQGAAVTAGDDVD